MLNQKEREQSYESYKILKKATQALNIYKTNLYYWLSTNKSKRRESQVYTAGNQCVPENLKFR